MVTDDHRAKRPVAGVLIIVGGLILLALGFILSIAVGAVDIRFSTVIEAIFQFHPDVTQHQIIRELRLPRSTAAVLVGAALAVSGAIMQGMTRNPLADPGILGINAGAGFMLAICFAFFPGLSFNYIILFSFAGAAISTVLVYTLGSAGKGGMSPVRLAIVGAAISALLIALSDGIALYFQIAQDLAFWSAGGIAGTKWSQVHILLPWIIAGLIGAMMLSRYITVLSLGEDVARGLGQRTGTIKLLGSILVLILAGASVSVVGAVGFVGLIIPHIVRSLVGVDYRWIIPCSAILGGLLMVLADIGGRMINPPYETPIGALIALIGVPFFLYLARKGGKGL
ncbi:ferrichrome ABC transporter permease [Paenibacillus selenitireducens]|uniref:Ferrichrome ABC transporter permease n=1 Tax=Paenibacillus selenitireducens TaxID=1324314 RepID=A0A1T2XNY0_9BACL|nr:iron ABC transporter permease [Paenibacillus selenitireducens]OPA81561.1 ferrichrome ABC transporter permease [Paenibacillus selenitireducens]